MFALLPNGAGGKRAPGCFWLFIERIWISAQVKVGIRFLLEAWAQIRPLEVLGRRFEGDCGQLRARPKIEFCAGLIPDMGNTPHAIAWLRIEGLGFEPSQEPLYGCVVDLAG